MKKDVETRTREFYDTTGWATNQEGKTGEDHLFRDFVESSHDYRQKVVQKIPAYFDEVKGRDLLIVGGGDLPQSHVLAAKKFQQVICVDISWRALKASERKLQQKGKYYKASMLDIPLPDRSVDAVLCAHVLYHIDKRYQEKAIRELIRVTRPNGRIVVLYTNPNAPLMIVQRFLKLIGINKLLGKALLYKYEYPLSWWSGFNDTCTIRILPLDVMSANQERVLIPGNRIGKKFYDWVSKFEERNPDLATRLWSYITAILDKSGQ
jgi:ubiquinone/menaquinone biosynthesis C-methylase UbiE